MIFIYAFIRNDITKSRMIKTDMGLDFLVKQSEESSWKERNLWIWPEFVHRLTVDRNHWLASISARPVVWIYFNNTYINNIMKNDQYATKI